MEPGLIWNEGRSIHIGLDRVGPVYDGFLEDLRSSESDARAMREIADRMGFASRLLIGDAATRENVRDCLEATIERLTDGDVLLVTFAGHMTTLAGEGDDPDGWDEAWCLYDGILLDDEFHDLLAEVPREVDVLVVTDSCFATGLVDTFGGGGGASPLPAIVRGRRIRASEALAAVTSPLQQETLVTAGGDEIGDFLPRTPQARMGDLEIARLVRAGAIPRGAALPTSQRRPISARVVAMAAAEEGSLAFDGEEHGLFTAALLGAVNAVGVEDVDYATLLDEVAARLPFQVPTLGTFGRADRTALGARAFVTGGAEPALRPADGGSDVRILEPKGK